MVKSWPLHVYLLEVKKLASYRIDFWMRLVVAALVRIFLAYYLCDALFSGTVGEKIGGFTREGMILYYILAAFVGNMVFAGIDRFGSEIYDGTLTRYLLYPVSFYTYQVATAFAYTSLCIVQLVLGVGVTMAFLDLSSAGIVITPLSLILGIGVTLLTSYNYLLLQAHLELMAFWVEAVWGLMVALYFLVNFFGGGLLPLSLFPEWVMKILNCTPFPYIIGLPVEIIMGNASQDKIISGVVVSTIWALILTFTARLVWRRGLKQYSGVGV